jgi:hypothetical protein
MSSPVQIFVAAARLDDPVALKNLLAPLRAEVAASMAAALREAGYGLSYNAEDATARYLISDGELASCFSVIGISEAEASAILADCKDRTDWSVKAFREAVARILGGTATGVN